MSTVKGGSDPAPVNPDSVLELVRLSLQQHDLAKIGEILEKIANLFSAFGSVIWEFSPTGQSGTEPEAGSFFALAQWFPNGII